MEIANRRPNTPHAHREIAKALEKTSPDAARRYREGIEKRLDLEGWHPPAKRNKQRRSRR